MNRDSIIPVDKFSPSDTDIILMDTNILIKLFYPLYYDKNNDKYDVLYKNLLNSKCSLLISSIQISEFVNKCIKYNYDVYCKTHPDNKNTSFDFKRDYRSVSDYKDKM